MKELDPASLEAMVPSMLLQPLVENASSMGSLPRWRAAASRCAAG